MCHIYIIYVDQQYTMINGMMELEEIKPFDVPTIIQGRAFKDSPSVTPIGL